MKRSSLLIITFALLVTPPVGHAQGIARQPPPPLRLTAEIINQSYCAINKLEILQMKLRLRYKNVGKQKLILYVGKNFFFQTRIRSIPGEAAVKPYEVLIVNSKYYDVVTEAVDRKSPSKVFVSLAPNDVYEREIIVGSSVVAEAAERFTNTLAGGEHNLHIIASTWYESRKLAEELRQRWGRKGLLVIDPLVSEPLKFTVNTHHAKVKCQ